MSEEDARRGPAESPESRDEDPDRQGFVRTALVFYGVMGCVALVWRMATPGQSIFQPGMEPLAEASGAWAAARTGLWVGLASVAISEILSHWTTFGDRLADYLGESLAGLRTGDAILLALASGTAEEMFFRGALQPAVGLVMASVIFGACHFLPRRDLAVWSLYAVFMGLAFGWIFESTGHLLAPIVAHTVVNGINLPRLARRSGNLAKD